MKSAKQTIFLRQLEPRDAELLFQIENLPDVAAHTLADDEPFTLSTAKTFVQDYLANQASATDIRLIICLEEGTTTSPAGTIELVEIDSRHKHAQVGIALLPQMRHLGIATAALNLLDRLAAKLEIHTLVAHVETQNAAANRLFQRADYQHVGQLPDYYFIAQQWRTINLYAKTIQSVLKV
ncbi:MAG: GNAT family N-acetyltransferase [Bacteroidaceae bacterium]|nr:GNAT family N-acetyltransferase [Bacteroidaceae bacterium]